MRDLSFAGQLLAIGLVVIVLMYGALFDPPNNPVARAAVRAAMVIAFLWLLIVAIVAATPGPA